MKNNTDAEKRLKILRSMIDRSAETTDAGAKKYFSVYLILDKNDKKEIPLAEHVSGAEQFDKLIKEARENEPYQIIVNVSKRKSEPRRKSNDFVVRFSAPDENEVVNTRDFIVQAISEQMEKVKEGLSGTPDDSGLGALEERFEHQGALLQLQTEKKILDLEHRKEIDDLNRQLADKEDEILQLKADYQELDNDYNHLEEDFEEYKRNKFNGLSEQLEQVGSKALAGLATKLMPLLSGGAGMAGLPDGAPGSATVVAEESSDVSLLTEQIREMLNGFTQEQFVKFYELMELIAKDKKTLDVVMQFLKPEKGGAV